MGWGLKKPLLIYLHVHQPITNYNSQFTTCLKTFCCNISYLICWIRKKYAELCKYSGSKYFFLNTQNVLDQIIFIKTTQNILDQMIFIKTTQNVPVEVELEHQWLLIWIEIVCVWQLFDKNVFQLKKGFHTNTGDPLVD